MTDWKLTGAIAATGLVPARREVHAAALVVAAAGRSLLPPRADDSHTSLSWAGAIAGFVGEPLPPGGVRAGLYVAGLTLCIVDATEHSLDELPLNGRTLADARDWLAKTLNGRVSSSNTIPPIELPDALAAERPAAAPFVKHTEAAELATYYANASHMLAHWTSVTSPIRIWPHHFDIAVLQRGPGDGQTIGIGMSPGDSSYGEPYWYVTPWPYSTAAWLPALDGGGTWHATDWVGAVLTASLMGRRDAETQRAQVLAFLESGVTASRAALCRRPSSPAS